MNDDDYSDITEIKIYTEKELNAEYEALNTLLIDTNGDWDKRCKAIKRLEGIIIGGAYQLDGFSAMMAKLAIHFTAQLNDLRSAVSKEACRMICLAAKTCQEKLESLCDKLISKEGLIKLINSANKVICENGNECFLTLLENVKCPKIIPRIIDEVSSKNTALRQKIAVYLKLIMETYPDSVIEKNAAGIENAINLAIADANKDVRQFTRQTFLIYQERFPNKAAKLQGKFDNSVQKALIEEAKEFSYSEKPIEQPKQKLSITKDSSKTLSESTKRDSLQKETSKPSRESTNTKRPSTTKEKEIVSKEIPFQESANENKFSSKPQTAELKKQSTKPLGETQEPRTNSQEDRVNKQRGVVFAEPQISPEKKRSSSIFQSQNNKPPERDKSASKILQNSMSTSAPLPKAETQVTAKSQNFDKIKFDDKEKDSGSTRPSSTSSKRPESNYTSEKQSSNKKEKPSSKTDLGPPLMNNFYQSIKEDDLKFLIDKSNDENWAVRSNSFEKINEFISDLKPNENISNNLLEELIDTHIQHINDFHYKVIITCQESFSKIITIYKQKILGYMDKVIPPIFLNLTEGKEKVYQSTNFVLNLINKIYTGDDLFPHFFRSLDFSQKAKYRASILEFMNIVLRNCKTYFNTPINIRTCIIKFAMLMAEFCNNKNIIMPCLGMILYLRDINFNAAMSAITTLNQVYLSNLRGIAAQYATDLEENIRYFNFQQRNAAKEKEKDRPQSPRKDFNGQEVISIPSRENSKKDKEESKSFGPVHEMSGITKKPNSGQDDYGDQVNEEEEEDEEEGHENDEENNGEEEYHNGEEDPEEEEQQDPDQIEEEEKEHDEEGLDQEYEEANNGEEEGLDEENQDDEQEEENNEEDYEEADDERPGMRNNKKYYEEEEDKHKKAQPKHSDKPPMPKSLPDLKKKESNPPGYTYQKSYSTDKADDQVDIIKNHDSPYEIAQNKKSGIIKKNHIPPVKNPQEEIPNLENLDAIISNYPKQKAYIEKNLDSIICQILEFFTAKEQSMIEYAMDILRKLLKLPFNFGMQIDQLLSCLISLYYSPFKFSATIDDMVRIVLNLGYADLCMHSMIENLEREDHPVLQILIKNITGMFVKKADPEIVKFLPDLMLKYKTLINHQNPDVRKNVVFSIVDLHAAYNTEMQEFIAEFSASHQKLITIYIQKRSEKKGK